MPLSRLPLTRRELVTRTLAAAAAGFSVNCGRAVFAQSRRQIEISPRAIDLVQESPVIDLLGLFTLDWPRLYSWYRAPETFVESEVVEEMNRVGMAIDVSHCSERTSLDAIRLSVRPILVTHSNCRALNPSQRRCKSGRVLRELAGKGGVIGLTAVRNSFEREGRSISRATSITSTTWLDWLDRNT
jgi:hypothetical protein